MVDSLVKILIEQSKIITPGAPVILVPIPQRRKNDESERDNSGDSGPSESYHETGRWDATFNKHGFVFSAETTGSFDSESANKIRLNFVVQNQNVTGVSQTPLNFTITGEHMMFTMLSTQAVSVSGSPVTSTGAPSLAVLSAISYSSSDSTVFTIAADPATPGGAIITGVGVGTATLTENATATEPGGATEQITGTATITLTSGVVTSGVASSISFAFGTAH